MDLEEVLNDVNDNYYQSGEENKEETIQTLLEIQQAVAEDAELADEFRQYVITICGGIFIPYVLWYEIYRFLENPNERSFIFEIIKAYVNSDFGEEERRLMKPLLMVYFAKEKIFEIDRIKAFILSKAHKSVQQYFNDILKFIEKNSHSVETLITKMKLLKGRPPEFELLRLPISQLKEQLALAK
jgi:hypothetical protein